MQNSNLVKLNSINISNLVTIAVSSQVYLKVASLSFVGNPIEQREMGQLGTF